MCCPLADSARLCAPIECCRPVLNKYDFNYSLPSHQIAMYPLPKRRDARMLCLDRHRGTVADRAFVDLPALLAPGDLLIFNDTRVIPARLYGTKSTGGRVEILVERVIGRHRATAKIRASRAPQPGARLMVGGAVMEVIARSDELFTLATNADQPIAEVIENTGHVPLPPYIDRADRAEDRMRYQSVWAARNGAVAAPTASLHFDTELLREVAAHGVQTATVTLHVGAGTYQSLRDGDVHQQRLHQERVTVDEQAVESILSARARGARVVAVGTTVVRSLETAARAATGNAAIVPFQGETELFLKPGDPFHVVDAMLTNFHEPQSSLLMLVSAFAGRRNVLDAYAHAVAEDYRFLSYGDAMWIA